MTSAGVKRKASAKGPRQVVVEGQPLKIDPHEPGREIAAALREEVADDLRTSKVEAAAATIADRKRRGISSTVIGYATGTLARGLRLQVVRSRVGQVDIVIVPPIDRLVHATAELRARILDAIPTLSIRGTFWDRRTYQVAAIASLRRMVSVWR